MKVWYNERPAWKRANEQDHIRFVRDFEFFIEHKGKTTTYVAPTSYVIDGASIPRPFWAIMGGPMDPLNCEAACAHDPFYLTHAVPRWMADEAAFQLWKPLTGLWGARIRWSAVRTGGYFSWKNNAKDKAELARVRAMLEARPDVAKFRSLWFAPSFD